MRSGRNISIVKLIAIKGQLTIETAELTLP